MSQVKLKRVLGLPSITFIAIGATIGGGVFVFTGIVFKITGAALPLAYGLAVIPVFISMMPLAMLGSSMPVVGGNYMYPSRMVSPGLAFTGVWVYALGSFFGQIPLYAIGCGNYLKTLFPGLSPTVFALSLVTIVFIFNVLGVELAAQFQALCVIVLISALIFYSVCGLGNFNTANFTGMFETGSADLFLGTALLTFTYFGSNSIIEMGGEIKNPGRTIPRAYFIAFPVIMIIYIMAAVATVGAVPGTELASYDEPLVAVSKKVCGNAGVWFFVIGGGVLALVTSLNALFIYGTRSLLVIIDDGLLPRRLGSLHPRFGTPWVLLFFVWLLSVVGIVSGFSLQTLASYAALGGLIIFLPMMLASVRFPALYPEVCAKSLFSLKGPLLKFCALTGICMVIFFGLILIYDLKDPARIISFLMFIASGVLFYIVRKKMLEDVGADFNTIFTFKKNEDDE